MPNRNNQFSAIVRVVAVGDEQTFPSGFLNRECSPLGCPFAEDQKNKEEIHA